jgi:hypothetical protein
VSCLVGALALGFYRDARRGRLAAVAVGLSVAAADGIVNGSAGTWFLLTCPGLISRATASFWIVAEKLSLAGSAVNTAASFSLSGSITSTIGAAFAVRFNRYAIAGSLASVAVCFPVTAADRVEHVGADIGLVFAGASLVSGTAIRRRVCAILIRPTGACAAGTAGVVDAIFVSFTTFVFRRIHVVAVIAFAVTSTYRLTARAIPDDTDEHRAHPLARGILSFTRVSAAV